MSSIQAAYSSILENQEVRVGSDAVIAAQSNAIDAQSDEDAMRSWVERFKRNKNTQDAARKEAFRLLLWSRQVGVEFGKFKLKTVRAYIAHLENPTPAEKWIGRGGSMFLKDGRVNPAWRPMRGPLKGASLKYAISMCGSFFEYMAGSGYVGVNPFRLLARSEKSAGVEVNREEVAVLERVVSHEAVEGLMAYLDSMVFGDSLERKHAARTRFVVLFLLSSGARRSELARAKMKDIRMENGGLTWTVTGKGNKLAKVPLPEMMIDELKSYRESMGLSPLPSLAEDGPMICSIYEGKKECLTGTAIYMLYKETVKRAADHWRVVDEVAASLLEKSSPHWLRHSFVSSLLQRGLKIEMVKDLARHTDINTTSMYNHNRFKELQEQVAGIDPTSKPEK